MEKTTIQIRRIREQEIFEKDDEVAVEHTLRIPLKNGIEDVVTCTPDYLEEMILARQYLAGDLDGKEYGQDAAKTLESVSLNEIFSIARDSFENPGPLFTDTGCAHSCALIYKGETLCHIEDIGRHNALDKVIGFALKHKIPMKNAYIFSSGRISGDYLSKVVSAGFPMAVSRAAVTNEAVLLAEKENITMLGFIRKNNGNLYHEGTVSVK